MLNLSTLSNIPSIYLILFFAVFSLLLVESIYYIKKQGNQEDLSGLNQPASSTQSSSILKKITPILGVVIIGFGAFYFLNKSKTTTEIPLNMPPQIKPSENQPPAGISTTPIIPVISPFLTTTLTPLPSKKTTPTKAPTPTKTIKSAITKTPIPTRPVSIGSPDTTIIVPKLPVAGSIKETLLYTAFGTIAVFLGLLL